MSQKSIKKNYIYNLSYEILLLITPLITTPYLSRVLGADGVGTVSYAESIVSYFVLVATLGLSTFGRREISYVQDNKEEQTRLFWEVCILQFLTSAIVLVAYIPFAIHQQNQVMYLILTFNILAVMANVVWFFQGLEEFGKVVLRNIFFKILSIVYIFVFVKSKNDLAKYVFGIAFFLFLSNVSLWLYLPRYIGKPKVKLLRPFIHIKPVMLLFIPTVAIQIYGVLDKTMIGMITQSSFENGYYEQALKISRMVLTIVTALGTVMIPRIGYHYGRGETEKVNSFMYRGYRFVWFLGIPLCFGLIGTSSIFVPWFFGEGFEKVIPLLSILSFLILAVGINNVTGMQYLIPTKRENLFTITVVIGAIVNFVLNYFLISKFQSIGAAVASVAAETVIAIVQLIIVRKEFSIKRIVFTSWKYWISGILMLIVLKLLSKSLASSVINTVVLMIVGALTYFFLLIILRDVFFIENSSNILNKIRFRLRR